MKESEIITKTKDIEEFFELDNGVNVKILIFDEEKCSTIIQDYTYFHKKEGTWETDLENRLKLSVNYSNQFLNKFNLSMEITGLIEEKCISSNHKIYLERPYKNNKGVWDFDTNSIDFMSLPFDLDRKYNEGGIFKQINLPFPVEEFLKPENGIYKYPFLDNSNNISYFEFPESYTNDKELIYFFNRCLKGVRKVN